MVTVLSDQHKVRFDGSSDLKHWTYLSEFGPAGATDGLWECPDLFPLPVEGEPGTIKWVLKVDALRGTGAQYFVGDFDRGRFTNDSAEDEVKRVDFGSDFYAAQSWNDEPTDRRMWIAWFNNWLYANDIPTSPWRGLFSIPRRLALRRFPESVRLIQQPIEELQQRRHERVHAEDVNVVEVNTRLAHTKIDSALEIDMEISPGQGSELGLKIISGDEEETRIGYDARSQNIFIDRSKSGDISFSERFGTVQRATLPTQEGTIRLHVFVDSCCVELFGNEGQVVMSDLIFPRFHDMRLELYAHGGDVSLSRLDIWNLTE
jgi:fructan beta-fructosidase